MSEIVTHSCPLCGKISGLRKPEYIRSEKMELFHVLNRGVEKRDIFMDDKDRIRFIHDLFEFNDIKPAGNTHHSFQYLDLRSPNMLSRKI